jgi:hypothetical protein
MESCVELSTVPLPIITPVGTAPPCAVRPPGARSVV